MDESITESRFAVPLRWIGLFGILAVAVLRCVTVFAPLIVFDVDPAIDPEPLGALGPAGSLLFDCIVLLSCGVALLGEWLARRTFNWLLLFLAIVPLPVVIWHGVSDAGDLWRGMTWASSALASVTILHLARDRKLRSFVIAVLIAAIVPIFVRGVSQVTYEHEEMVAQYNETRDEILKSRGWEPGSSAAQIYERRVMQREPRGWFTTTNVFASFVAFGFVVFTGLTLAIRKARLESGWVALMALCAIACVIMLSLSGSKGAIGAALIGLFLLIGSSVLTYETAKWLGLAVIGCIALTLLSVVIRGVVLPEQFAGEKSLLFRWHYMQASAGIIAENPMLGVGPDGYQDAYTAHRPPRIPEEVKSAHSMFLDWLSTMGIAGFAWIALVLLQFLRPGSSNADIQVTYESENSYTTTLRAVGLALCALLPSLYIELQTLDAFDIALRSLGILGFATVVIVVGHAIQKFNSSACQSFIVPAVATVVIHSQIEMTFFEPGSVLWAMIGLAAFGSAREDRRSQHKSARTVIAPMFASGIIVFALWLSMWHVLPALRQQGKMTASARILGSITNRIDDRSFVASQRVKSAEGLVDAYNVWPINVLPLEVAAMQYELAAESSYDPEKSLREAEQVLLRAIHNHHESSSRAQFINVSVRLAHITGNSSYWSAAIEEAVRLTDLDPNGLSSWKRLGDVLWLSGEKSEAAEAYQKALECNANFELDELKQLPQLEVELMRNRIQESQTTANQ